MPDLNFRVEGAEPQRFAAAPLLLFKLRVTEAAAAGHADADPRRRAPLPGAHRAGPAPLRRRRAGTARSTCSARRSAGARRCGRMLWTHASAVVPPFTGSTVVDLPVPCSYDFSLAATKYFAALEDGDIPLCFLFSGTIFYEAADGGLQVAQISWEKEAYLPPAGGDVAGADGPLLSEQRLALPAQGRVRSAQPVQEPRRACRPGSRRWNGCCPRPEEPVAP